MYNNLNNSFYDEGVRNTKSNNNNELNYNNDLSASLTFKSIRLESPVSILREKNFKIPISHSLNKYLLFLVL